MGDWVKCSEQMPENLRTVLISGDYCDFDIAWYDEIKNKFYGHYGHSNYNKKEVTHWMVLPESPNNGEQ